MASASGRFFVSGYYWWRPVLATVLKKLPFLMPPVRFVLKVFANLYRRFEPNRFG
jgi:hypothetical protein